MSNIFIELKMTCLGVLERGNRNKDNGTGLKVGEGIEIEMYKCFPYTRCTLPLSIRFCISLFDILYVPSQSSLHFHV